MIDYYISVRLSNEDLVSDITVKKTVSENDSKALLTIINKISTGDSNYTKPVSKFLNDKIVTIMVCELNYLITNAELIINDKMLLDFYHERGARGVNSKLIKIKFPYISPSRIVSANFNLNINSHIIPTTYIEDDLYGGYVLKKYFKKNQQLMNEYRLSKSKTSNQSTTNETNESSESSESKLHESDGDISKNEQKLLRKSIINIATKSDINIAGFTKDFLDSLDEKNKKYIKSLSELKIKIMRSEISKKYK